MNIKPANQKSSLNKNRFKMNIELKRIERPPSSRLLFRKKRRTCKNGFKQRTLLGLQHTYPIRCCYHLNRHRHRHLQRRATTTSLDVWRRFSADTRKTRSTLEVHWDWTTNETTFLRHQKKDRRKKDTRKNEKPEKEKWKNEQRKKDKERKTK